MRRLPRKLLMWGGAATIAGAGFAFMASNTIGTSYVGEGSHAVSGYNVYNITYSGVTSPGGGQVGTMTYLGNSPSVLNSMGIPQQDGVTTVSFQLSPDNALWAAVQLYNSSKVIIGGGGASNCSESAGVWTCTVTSTDGHNSVPGNQIAYIDVEAAR